MSDVEAWSAARVGLGRRGVSLPTAAMLRFQADHAAARDAVHARFDAEGVRASLRRAAVDTLDVSTQASSRREYLLRPDLGRALAEADRGLLERRAGTVDLALIVSDGLSATAANLHAAAFVVELLDRLPHLRVAPVLVVPLARVGVLNDAGDAMRARAAAIVLGERPGLSAPDGLSFYFEVAPRRGLTDADRNCIANIRPSGLPIPLAARRAAALVTAGLQRGISGTALQVEDDHAAAPDVLDGH